LSPGSSPLPDLQLQRINSAEEKEGKSMKQPIRLNNTIPLFLVTLTCLAFGPTVEAVNPPPDGGYQGHNTAEGKDALFSLTTGTNNTVIGFEALFHATTPIGNTAVGSQALFQNTSGGANTAIGHQALDGNTTGNVNTAVGFGALAGNTTGSANTAIGSSALLINGIGFQNTATGVSALQDNEGGSNNTANGYSALLFNSTGSNNTAIGSSAMGGDSLTQMTGSNNTATGYLALERNTTGSGNTVNGVATLRHNSTGNNNTANGVNALSNNESGSNNIALGADAGLHLSGSDNIDIGNAGANGDSGTIRVGTNGTQTKTFIAGINNSAVDGSEVKINNNGRLGVAPSSKRFKAEIKPMDNASEVILALKPVTFHYKPDIDPEGIEQFGLVAEEVEKVNPALVARDAYGKPYTVRYDAVNAMLLNEFLKEHRKVEQLEKQVQTLTAGLQEVNARLGVKPMLQAASR
jgi:hypothetical protein